MRRAILLGAGLMVIAGCGNPEERAYYQTRYVPTSADTAFSSAQRASWKGDRSVYELPAAVPDLDQEALPLTGCERPGPRFRPQPVVGLHGEALASGAATFQEAGGWDTRPIPLGALSPLPGYPAGVQRGPDVAGIVQPHASTPAGTWDSRPPIHGTALRPVEPIGAMREQEKTDYCMPPEAPTAPAPR
mgnify:CR=1 FL=1